MSTIWFGIGKRWRGVAIERTLFGLVVRFGWISLWLPPFDPPEWAKEWHGKLESVLSRSRQQSAGKGQQR